MMLLGHGRLTRRHICSNGLCDEGVVMQAKDARGNYVKMTNEEFLLELSNKNIPHIPLEEYKGSQVKIKFLCTNGHIFETRPASVLRGTGCPYCANQKILEGYNDFATTHKEFLKIWDYEKNDILPTEIFAHSNKKVWWKCKLCHSWQSAISSVTREDVDKVCPYCNGHKVLIGFNDLWTTRPDVARLLSNHDDGYKVTEHSNKKLLFECDKCYAKVKRQVNHISQQGFHCDSCSDGISFGEKIITSLLKQLDIDFIHEALFKWSDRKRYDFYIESISMIIEAHGIQHYEESRTFRRSLQEEQENDLYKYNMAMINGIKNYIVIDCRYSDFDYIRKSILDSDLNGILDLRNIDWNECNNATLSSNLITACDMYNDGINIDIIASNLNMHTSSIRSYLKRGTKLGICFYDPEEAHRQSIRNFVDSRKRKVRCRNDMKTFDSIKEASLFYDISESGISGVLSGKRRHIKNLVFEYL